MLVSQYGIPETWTINKRDKTPFQLCTASNGKSLYTHTTTDGQLLAQC